MKTPLVADKITSLVRKQQDFYSKCISLVAAHNLMSDRARELLSELGNCIQSGYIGMRSHSGGKYIDEIETLALELGKKLFRASYVEYRPVSGSMANEIALISLTKPGDRIMTFAPKYGGHFSCRGSGFAGHRSLVIEDIPFNENEMNVDTELMAEAVQKAQPKLIVVGTSRLLFPYPMKRIKKIAEGVGARVMYDAAHILGLMAGRRFQDPIQDGCDVTTGSTQKTLPGPVGGLILTQDADIAKEIHRATNSLLDNYHNNRVAAIAMTLAEMLEFGEEYADQVIRNARALAAALDAEGFEVLAKDKGYTASHIVLMNVKSYGGNKIAHSALERANIMCSRVNLPSDYPDLGNPSGLRLGTNLVTRLGMREGEMPEIAHLIRRALIDKEKPERVRRDAMELRERFKEIEYCF